jgi:hypothetical protein
MTFSYVVLGMGSERRCCTHSVALGSLRFLSKSLARRALVVFVASNRATRGSCRASSQDKPRTEIRYHHPVAAPAFLRFKARRSKVKHSHPRPPR